MQYNEMILRFPDFKTRAVTLSFDDGAIDDRKMVEILNSYGIKCTFNLNSERLGEKGMLGREFVSLKTETPKIFYIWGHSYEMDYGADYWVKLEEFFKLISNKEDVFYGTNKEVLL